MLTFIGVLVSPETRKILPNISMSEINTEGIATMRRYLTPSTSTLGSAPINLSKGSAKNMVTIPKIKPIYTENIVDCFATS